MRDGVVKDLLAPRKYLDHTAGVAAAPKPNHEPWPGGPVFLAEGSVRGHDGVTISGGQLVNQDTNRKLTPAEWRGSYNCPGLVDRMKTEDPVGQAIDLARRLPQLGARATVVAYSDGEEEPQPADRQVADFVSWALFDRMRPGWDAWLGRALDFAPTGSHYDEVVQGFDKAAPLPGGAYVIDCLAPRPLKSVWGWERDGDAYNMVQAPQQGDGARHQRWGRGVTLEAKRLFGLRLNPADSSPEPLGMFRPACGAFLRRSLIAKARTDGTNRYAYSVPQIYVDESVVGYNAANRAWARKVAMQYRADIYAGDVMPPGYRLEFTDVKFDAASLLASELADAREFALAGLAGHLFTGWDNGTETLYREQLGQFAASLNHDLRVVAREVSKRLIRWLVDRNFGHARYPNLEFSEVVVVSPLAVAEAIVSAGVGLDPGDGAAEDKLREALSIAPKMTVDPREVAAPEPKPEPEPSPDDMPDDEADAPDDVEELSEPVALADRVTFVRSRSFGDRFESRPDGQPPTDAESVLRLSETLEPVESAKAAFVRDYEAWQARMLPTYAEQGAQATTLDQLQAVPVPMTAALEAALLGVMGRTYDAGKASVVAESARQRANPELQARIAAGARVSEDAEGQLQALSDPARVPCGCGSHGPAPLCSRHGSLVALAAEMLASTPGDVVALVDAPAPDPTAPPSPVDAINPDRTILGIVRTSVVALARRVRDAVVSAAQAASIGGDLAALDLEAVITSAVEALSTGPVAAQAQQDVNTTFGLARVQQQRAEGIERFQYSTMLESDRCDPCISHDNDVFPVSELELYATPATWCDGGARCNCINIGLILP